MPKIKVTAQGGVHPLPPDGSDAVGTEDMYTITLEFQYYESALSQVPVTPFPLPLMTTVTIGGRSSFSPTISPKFNAPGIGRALVSGNFNVGDSISYVFTDQAGNAFITDSMSCFLVPGLNATCPPIVEEKYQAPIMKGGA